MNKVCFVFASAVEKNPDRIITKYLKDGEYDIKFLCSKDKDKILKKDIDLDMSELEKYKLVSPIGAESLKYVAGLTGITKYNGIFVEKKYLPIMHPNMCIFKPQLEDDIRKAFRMIPDILSDKNVKGILINIFGGIMRCDVLAQGVVDAAKETNLNVPIVVRLAGTNFEEGKKILNNSNLKILSADDLNDASKKIVEAIR